MKTCPYCRHSTDPVRCPVCGRCLMDELVRDDHAAALVPHAVEGVAWWTPFLTWQQLAKWQAMNKRGED